MSSSLVQVRRLGRAAAVFSLIALGAACARHPEADQAAPEAEGADPDAPTELVVSNAHWLDITIFVVHDGQTSRVGTATAASTTSFVLRRWMLGPTRTVRLIGNPIGAGSNVQTELIHIQPGQFIEWRLESQLVRSTVAVY